MKRLPATVALYLLTAVIAGAAQDPRPLGARHPAARPLADVPSETLAPVDVSTALEEDATREAQDLPPRFALPIEVHASPSTSGLWEEIEPGRLLWRLRFVSKGARSLNIGFTRYWMPAGGRLFVYSPDFRHVIGPFTDADNAAHGELWTPVVPGDEVVVEVTLPADVRDEVELLATRVSHDYRGFGTPDLLKSGACNVDVICPQGDNWRDQIRSVAVYSLGGGTFCTGAMVNNTAGDKKPYFLTANHCGLNSGNAASLVTYWNYQNSVCRPPGSAANGGPGDGSLSQFETGSFFRAANAPSDFTLLELDSTPNPVFNIFWVGWDRTSADPPCSPGQICPAIHHPNTDEKRITFSDRPMATTSSGGTTSPGDGTHIWVKWSRDATTGAPTNGVTEPGSSGSPLFNQAGRVVGQLHGGLSSCAATFDNVSDYYGRLSVSWAGGGTNATRLSNWLDPGNTGATTLDGTNQCTPPSAPTSLAATPNGNNRVDLSWTASAGAATYDVYRSDGACPGTGRVRIASGITGTSHADTPVSGGLTYSYRVTARGADTCESTVSNCDDALATGACVTPPTFAGLASAANAEQSSCTLSLSWTAATPACGSAAVYNVYRSTVSGFVPGPANRIASCVVGTTYNDTAVTNGTRYYYVVRAEDNVGGGPGPCGGNEDTNTVQKTNVPSGPPIVKLQDDMESGAGNWTASGSGGGVNWALVTTASHSPTHSFFVDDPAFVTDRTLAETNAVLLGPAAGLEFYHRFNTERSTAPYDGGVLEYSTNGTTWQDILAGDGAGVPANASRFLQAGYNTTISSCCTNPLAGRPAWSGDNGSFEQVKVDLADFAGRSVRFRWRMGTDSSIDAVGWWVDDARIAETTPCGGASGFSFYTLTPCRVVDTRATPDGPLAGPALVAGAERIFTMAGTCSVPATAKALSLNVAVTQPTSLGNLRLYSAGVATPSIATLNYSAGQTRSNNAIVPLDATGRLAAYCAQAGGTVHLIIDVNGYFE